MSLLSALFLSSFMYSVVLRLVEKSVHSLVGLLASTLTTPRHATAEALANAHARGVSFE